MKKLYNKYKKYLVAPLITIAIVLIVYVLKGIYPFGNLTIANGDMGQAYMTFYYYLYDICHGTKSVFYDYNLGMGSNIYGGFIIDGLLNPSVFVILLNKREMIPYMFSYVLILKYATIALTSFILFKKINKKNEFYNYIFSIMYALSAYTLTYNTNLMWLDVVGLFPLFILATKHMFDTNKVYYFGITLALILIFNYNIAYMVLMFIIFIIPIYIHYALPKEKRKVAAFNLLLGILLSLGLSAFAFLPSFLQVRSSYRFSGAIYNTTANIRVLYKLIMFYFYSLPVYFYIKWFLNKNRDKLNFKMHTIGLTLSAIIPIIFERVNLMWHSGSYQGFPFRYGFVPIMILFTGALYSINEIKETKEKEKLKLSKIIPISTLFIITIVVGIITAKYINTNNPAINVDIIEFLMVAVLFIVTLVLTFIIDDIRNKKTKYILIGSLSLIVSTVFTYSYVGVPPKYRMGYELSDEGVFYSNKIYDKHLDSGLYRMKDLSYSIYENSPAITNVPSMSTFLHIISGEQVLNAKQLGYSTNNTKLNDLGGTIFTDAIYGVKYVLSRKELNDRIYKYVDMIEDNYLYEYKNILHYGILYNEEIEDIPKEYKVFSANNYLYQKLFHKEDNIIDIRKFEAKEEDSILEYDIEVSEEKELYLYIDETRISRILINGNCLIIPLENDPFNAEYNTEYDNGSLDLGLFKNETVHVTLLVNESKQRNKYYEVEFGLLDINKYERIFNTNHDIKVSVNKNKINVSGNVSEDTNIFLPITYDKGFSSNVKIKRVYNTFIGVPLEKGKNNITLTFKPYFYTKSLYITIITIVLMIICYFIKRVFDIRNVKFLITIFWFIELLIYIFFVYRYYIKTIFDTFIGLFK